METQNFWKKNEKYIQILIMHCNVWRKLNTVLSTQTAILNRLSSTVVEE